MNVQVAESIRVKRFPHPQFTVRLHIKVRKFTIINA